MFRYSKQVNRDGIEPEHESLGSSHFGVLFVTLSYEADDLNLALTSPLTECVSFREPFHFPWYAVSSLNWS